MLLCELDISLLIEPGSWVLSFFCLNFMNESLKNLFYCLFEVIVSFVIHERRVFMVEYWRKIPNETS